MAIDRQLAELERLAARARHVLLDARKQKWHEDTRSQLQQIEAEISRLRARETGSKVPVAAAAPH